MRLSNLKTGILLAAAAIILICGRARAEDTQRYWVFFRDKGIMPAEMSSALDQAALHLTPAARERREKEMPVIVDEYDLPVNANFIAEVKSTRAQVRRASRWLNAVSVAATNDQVQRIKELPFVRSVERFRLQAMRLPNSPTRSLDFEYGPSLTQNQMCRIPELHERGLSGEGILMCMLDTGAWLEHVAFDSLDIVATYDFIFGDSVVADEAGQDSLFQHLHGTAVLSAMAGFDDSLLIGPAYGASMLVAKTEWIASETPAEEDNYVAALEWADSLGARITSSSLGYIDWYSIEDLDGQTAVTTIAVNVAVSRGILVCTAAGNEGGGDWNFVVTPADADSILAVGGVTNEGSIIGFSSRGPTADGRIKPDVCAMGADVFAARSDSNDYWTLSGTSMATPIVAGIAALIMEAHPNWTAQMVRTAMLNTASNHNTPDNDYGWGIVDAVEAADYVFTSADEHRLSVPRSPILISTYPNPVNGTATLRIVLPMASEGKLGLFDVLGREVYAWPKTTWTAGENRVILEGSDLATGVYLARFSGYSGTVVGRVVILK